jgi:hypothetical protein
MLPTLPQEVSHLSSGEGGVEREDAPAQWRLATSHDSSDFGSDGTHPFYRVARTQERRILDGSKPSMGFVERTERNR